MNVQNSTPTTPLRARMIADMSARNLGPASQRPIQNGMNNFMVLQGGASCVGYVRSTPRPLRSRWSFPNPLPDGGSVLGMRRCVRPPIFAAALRTPWRRRRVLRLARPSARGSQERSAALAPHSRLLQTSGAAWGLGAWRQRANNCPFFRCQIAWITLGLPSVTPRAFAAASASLVRREMASRSCRATSAMIPTVRSLASDMSRARKRTPLSRRVSRNATSIPRSSKRRLRIAWAHVRRPIAGQAGT
jgi:hypothetical protein